VKNLVRWGGQLYKIVDSNYLVIVEEIIYCEVEVIGKAMALKSQVEH